jgi:hypothetical protein
MLVPAYSLRGRIFHQKKLSPDCTASTVRAMSEPLHFGVLVVRRKATLLLEII